MEIKEPLARLVCFIMYGWRRATITHDLTSWYLLVSVSLGGKSISLRRYCENASCIGVHPSAAAFGTSSPVLFPARSKCNGSLEVDRVFPFLLSFFPVSIKDHEPFGF
jgi:hypothetical protein